MDKRFAAIVAVIILAFVGVVIFNRQDASAPGGSADVKATNHVKGDGTKKVTLVEYGDFQCPVCGIYEPTLREVYEKYKNDIQFQFRHFPLQQIHENALAGSRAAEAAGMQGKFWEMHDQLFDNQQLWSSAPTPQQYFEQFAKTIGLNVEQYKTDFASEKVNNIIKADIAEGSKLKVSGTPGIVLDGKLLNNSDLTDDKNQPQLDKFSKLIDAALASKK